MERTINTYNLYPIYNYHIIIDYYLLFSNLINDSLGTQYYDQISNLCRIQLDISDHDVSKVFDKM